MAKIKTFEEFLNESSNNFKLTDFPIGALVHMDDEIWIVSKPGVKSGNILMTPYNKEAKSRYVSIAIEFDLNWLNNNVTKIEKK